MTAILLTAWRWILSSRIAQGVAVVGAFILYHFWKVASAGRKGRREGRQGANDRIRQEQDKHRKEITDESQEIDRDYADLDRDDLRGRMRDSASNSDRR